jgi:hypothetical protein
MYGLVSDMSRLYGIKIKTDRASVNCKKMGKGRMVQVFYYYGVGNNVVISDFHQNAGYTLKWHKFEELKNNERIDKIGFWGVNSHSNNSMGAE